MVSVLSFTWGQETIDASAKQLAEKSITQKSKSKVSFTLRNNSAKSIPLIIPSVMKPNLSPNSNSGVTLKMGQEILFRSNGKKRILLVVDETIKEGDVIDCLLYTSPSPRDATLSRMPSSA